MNVRLLCFKMSYISIFSQSHFYNRDEFISKCQKSRTHGVIMKSAVGGGAYGDVFTGELVLSCFLSQWASLYKSVLFFKYKEISCCLIATHW